MSIKTVLFVIFFICLLAFLAGPKFRGLIARLLGWPPRGR